MERLTAEEFIKKLENATEWSVSVNIAGRELELHVKEDGEPKMMLGPDPLHMDLADYLAFIKHVDIFTSKPSIRLTPEEFIDKMRESDGKFVIEKDEQDDFLLRVTGEFEVITYLGPVSSGNECDFVGNEEFSYFMGILERTKK